MREIVQLLQSAVDDGDVPFVVGAVGDRSGVVWKGAAGEARPDVPADPDMPFRLWSAGKALAGVAVAMTVERGQVTLETPVTEVLPEFHGIRLRRVDDQGNETFHRPTATPTVRHLLTHTAGFDYATSCGLNVNDGHERSLFYPLVFEPGESVRYGIGFEWLGRLVERVDGRTFDRFCAEELFVPLGLRSFRFTREPDEPTFGSVRQREPDGSFAEAEFMPPLNPEYYSPCWMFGSAPDYCRFLRLILNDGIVDGEQLLGAEALALITHSQMRDVSIGQMVMRGRVIDPFPGTRSAWTAAFLRNESPQPGRRPAGSLSWAGWLNTHYWVDPATGLSAALMTQLLPFFDAGFMATYEKYERLVYGILGP